MTREETIKKAWEIMVELQKNYTWEKHREWSSLISDWNSEHYEDYSYDNGEIFACDEREDDHIRLYLEDDYIDIEC